MEESQQSTNVFQSHSVHLDTDTDNQFHSTDRVCVCVQTMMYRAQGSMLIALIMDKCK
jgi:hypothetical protein